MKTVDDDVEMSNGVVSQRNLLYESHLCFNKSLFSRANFSVERFVNLVRRRASLEQIHNDLKIYLKIVQNSMIELINDDYADFVNLSSNLVGLKETIDKLAKDIEVTWLNFCSSTESVRQSAELVEQKVSSLIACRQAQFEIRAQIALIISIERLSDLIACCPEEIEEFWLQSFTDSIVDMILWFNKVKDIDEKVEAAYHTCLAHVGELAGRWLVQDLKGDCLFAEQILDVISLKNDIDTAVSRVMTEVIDEKLSEPKENLEDFLNEIYESILKLRNDWEQRSKTGGKDFAKIAPFLDKCLLTWIVSALDQHFGSVIVPSDSHLFHRCYTKTINFISNWPSDTHVRTILRMIRDKFSLVVYFKLVTQHFITQMNEQCDPSSLNPIIDKESEGKKKTMFYGFSKIVVHACDRIWSDEVYLPTLVDKSWDFFLKVLVRYLEWIDNIKKCYWTDGKALEDSEVWRILCALCADCMFVDSQFFEIALTSIWPKIRAHELEVTPFGQCLSTFSSNLAEKIKELEEIIVADFMSVLTKILDGVCGIPRQYRWTKKPAPTEVSHYVVETSAAIKSCKDEMERCCWSEENITSVYKRIFSESVKIFSLKTKQVLESVEQTETSLQRFKRKSLISNENNIDSDESKIRRQLLLDLEYFKDWAASCEVEFSDIESIMLRADPSGETSSVLDPVCQVLNMTHIQEKQEE
ncbi:unnamed protein product [Thelazia callipaeda]|uniref:Conserved oligomeric Golgi complex subunit 2 n=1 Tax=Thelazia callipaeda TaxID=103827 RepID=A0A158RCR2_THECL|nr:unnamed protein product [Thelazia callipaeda]